MSAAKRVFDVSVASVLMLAVAPVIAVLLCVVLLSDGRPLFHVSRRMNGPRSSFWMWKIRTMTPCDQPDGVTGGHAAGRITATGRWLRKWRLDELPQLWNVLRGEMSLVGPRPPLPRYAARYPTLYAHVLRVRPGITGLGTLRFLTHEDRILSRCVTAAQTDETYARHCLKRKARVDLIYQRHWSLGLDMVVLWRTVCALSRGFRG